MRGFLCLFCFFTFQGLLAQGKLTEVTVDAQFIDGEFYIEQKLFIEADTVQSLELKALKFENSTISEIRVESLKTVDFEVQEEDEIVKVQVKSYSEEQPAIIVYYKVKPLNPEFYIPIFFTDLQASDSDNGFFNMNIRLSEEQGYFVHFPTVEIRETIAEEDKSLSFDLPALPSVIRMEWTNGNNGFWNYINMADWIVAVIFVIIAILIWRNRKQLIYG